MPNKITYEWVVGPTASEKLLKECVQLYSRHYGKWSTSSSIRPGQSVRLSLDNIRQLLADKFSGIWLARNSNDLIGYAIALRANVEKYGTFSWVTQLVVHKQYRNRGIGKALLFSIWGFSTDFCWGLVSANPYAIRALEKATRRRCTPTRIKTNVRKLSSFGSEHISYIQSHHEVSVTDDGSIINTEFYVDHSQLQDMLDSVTSPDKPWLLGNLEEGWEWLAFCFHDQVPIELTSDEIDLMLTNSDEVVRQAYSRMTLDGDHFWMRHSAKEIQQIIEWCKLEKESLVIDIGCGTGRHVRVLDTLEISATGLDYAPALIERAKQAAADEKCRNVLFIEGDCRVCDFPRNDYDAALCLYDVIGTYADNRDNQKILNNISRQIKHGGYVIFSVMNYTMTASIAKTFFTLRVDPGPLLSLPSSQTMEKSGDIFNPDYFIVDTETKVVYRKEQFLEGGSMPVELIVRDRRFCPDDISKMCKSAGLEIEWMRPVRSGRWETALDLMDSRAKEILVLCRRQ